MDFNPISMHQNSILDPIHILLQLKREAVTWVPMGDSKSRDYSLNNAPKYCLMKDKIV